MMRKELFSAIFIAVFLVMGFVVTEEKVVLDTQNNSTVVVKSGESLWTIASRITPNTVDVREMIYAVKKINNLDDSFVLSPGMTLKVPTTKTINTSKSLYYMAQN